MKRQILILLFVITQLSFLNLSTFGTEKKLQLQLKLEVGDQFRYEVNSTKKISQVYCEKCPAEMNYFDITELEIEFTVDEKFSNGNYIFSVHFINKGFNQGLKYNSYHQHSTTYTSLENISLKNSDLRFENLCDSLAKMEFKVLFSPENKTIDIINFDSVYNKNNRNELTWNTGSFLLDKSELLNKLQFLNIYPQNAIKLNEIWETRKQYLAKGLYHNKISDADKYYFYLDQYFDKYAKEIRLHDSLISIRRWPPIFVENNPDLIDVHDVDSAKNHCWFIINKQNGMIQELNQQESYIERKKEDRLIETKTRYKLLGFKNGSHKTLIIGKIDNPKCNKVKLSYLKYDIGTINKTQFYTLSNDGRFSIELDLPHTKGLTLDIDPYNLNSDSKIYCYIDPGDTLSINVNADSLLNTVSFSGKSSINSAYYTRFSHNYLNNYKLIQTFWDFAPEDLIAIENRGLSLLEYQDSLYRDEVRKMEINMATTYSTPIKKLKVIETEKISPSLRNYLCCEVIYKHARNIIQIQKKKNNYTKPTLIDTLNINLYTDINSLQYRLFLDVYINYKLDKAKNNVINISTNSGIDLYFFTKLFYSGYPLYSEIAYLQEDMMLCMFNVAWTKEVNFLSNDFIDQSENVPIKNIIKSHINNYNRWNKGELPPEFSCIDVNGNTKTLADFKGKLVVIKFDRGDYTYDKIKKYSQTPRMYEDLANEFTDITFLLITSEFNFEKLKEDMKNKNSKVNLLLYKKDSLEFDEVFFTGLSPRISILNKKGRVIERVSFVTENSIKRVLNYKEPPADYSKELKIIGLLLAGFLLGGILIWLILRNYNNKKIEREKLKRQVGELELKAIRAQMNPHFMYNCLNSIQNLIQQNKNDDAYKYISRFADLLRQILKNSEKNEIPINEEITAIATYLELESLRFNFTYNIEIDEKLDVFNTYIPGMLIQPHVENAIIHGLLNKNGEKNLNLKLYTENKFIYCEITDNGIGRENNSQLNNDQTGLGIKLTRERIDILNKKYDEQFSFNISDIKDEKGEIIGTKVLISIPDEI